MGTSDMPACACGACAFASGKAAASGRHTPLAWEFHTRTLILNSPVLGRSCCRSSARGVCLDCAHSVPPPHASCSCVGRVGRHQQRLVQCGVRMSTGVIDLVACCCSCSCGEFRRWCGGMANEQHPRKNNTTLPLTVQPTAEQPAHFVACAAVLHPTRAASFPLWVATRWHHLEGTNRQLFHRPPHAPPSNISITTFHHHLPSPPSTFPTFHRPPPSTTTKPATLAR